MERGLVAIIDGVFVRKDADVTVTFVEFDQIGTDEDLANLATLLDEEKDLLSAEDVQELAAGLQPNSSAAALVFEHTWAAPLKGAIEEAGGRLVATLPRSGAGRGRGPGRPVRGIGRFGQEKEGTHHETTDGRPGLVGTMARTAVIAGTATAVSGGVSRRQQASAQASAQDQAAQQAAAAPAAPTTGGDDFMAKLQQLAELKAAGVLSDEEFTAAKAKLLA